jgi:hypothetical protein
LGSNFLNNFLNLFFPKVFLIWYWFWSFINSSERNCRSWKRRCGVYHLRREDAS